MELNSTVTVWFYYRSSSPVHTHTLPAQDDCLPKLLDDVRMVRHGSHIFIHLRSDYEWERAMHFLSEAKTTANAHSAA